MIIEIETKDETLIGNVKEFKIDSEFSEYKGNMVKEEKILRVKTYGDLYEK